MEALALEALDPLPAAPWVRASFVVSLDGAVAIDGDSRGLSNSTDRDVYHHLRQQSDAVIVGSITAAHPGYAHLHQPLVVVSRTGAVKSSARQLIIVTTHDGAVRARRDHAHATVIETGSVAVDLDLAHARLLDLGLERLLCEGGPRLFRSMLMADCIDELCITISPHLVGHGPRLLDDAGVTRLTLARTQVAGEMVFVRYLLRPLP